MNKLPKFIKIKDFNRTNYTITSNLIEKSNLNTVCIEANCPNKYECFSKGTAAFLILGDICTRNCLYCNIKKGKPNQPDSQEPRRIAEAVKKLGLNYAVITCVTRDDLKDGGAEHFVKIVREIRSINPSCKVELLLSDLNGNWSSLKKIVQENPEVINHNIEVVKELFLKLRPKGNYSRSIQLLKKVKEINPEVKTKSGLMIGLGETKSQIIRTLTNLKNAGCNVLTIGQYLQPTKTHPQIVKYYTLKQFDEIKKIALSIGFNYVEAGPLVRSSYHAKECEGSL